MSKRVCIQPMSPQEVARAMAVDAVDAPHSSQLETLAQLVEQIDDALLVVEHPRLAARVYAALGRTKAA